VAFSGLGLLMAGTLKAEATLAAANLVFLLLLVGGGVIVPLDKFPDTAQSVLGLLPISALSGGLRDVLQHGAAMPWGDAAVLAVWSVLGLGAAARFFRWE
jgi:ABC-2 type transport system permease protein